jgi:hypothetical protein
MAAGAGFSFGPASDRSGSWRLATAWATERQPLHSGGSTVHGMSGVVRIEEACSASDELLAAVRGLVSQLSSSARPPTSEDLVELVGSPACRLLIARDGDDQGGTSKCPGRRTWSARQNRDPFG